MTHDGAGLLEGMPPSFMAARYHSLAVDPATLPPELRVTAMSEVDRVIMGIRHVALPLEGVQFHPESVLTPQGPHLLANFLRQAGEGEASRLDDATGSFATAGLAEAIVRGRPVSELVRSALNTIVDGGTLSMDEARAAMGAVMDGEATPAQLAALLMGLRMRGETVDELAGFAGAMRERSVRVEAPDGAIDVVGTGGDGSGTFNISTTAALVAAAAGVPVAKHGNRAMTSKAGSADVLDALGIRIDHDAASAGVALRTHRLRVPVRAELPPGDEARRPDPAGDRGQDGVQPGRPADQPGRHDAAAAGRRRPGRRRADGRGRAPAGDRADLRHPRRRRRRAAARRQRRRVHRGRRHDRASRHRRRRARVQARGDRTAGRRDARRERAAERGRPARRARQPARRRPPQRRRGAARGGRRRPAGGGDRTGRPDHRRRAGRRAPRGPARRATDRRGGERAEAGAAPSGSAPA